MREQYKSYGKTFPGVRLEDSGFRNPVVRFSIPLAEFLSGIRRTEVEGTLPKEGPAIVVVNHTNSWDGIVIEHLAVMAKRTIRVVARDSLINPDIIEEQAVLERTNKVLTEEEKHPGVMKRFNRRAFAKLFVLAANPIPIHRGNPGPEFFRNAKKVIESGQMFGMFLQETRTPQDDLSNAMSGIGLFARKFPDVPIYAVTITNSKRGQGQLSAKIEEPFTYKNLSPDGEMNSDDVTDHIVGLMAAQLRKTLPSVKMPIRK